MAMWNPWRGCKKCSDGCLHCYIHKGDSKRNVDTNEIINSSFTLKKGKKFKKAKEMIIELLTGLKKKLTMKATCHTTV